MTIASIPRVSALALTILLSACERTPPTAVAPAATPPLTAKTAPPRAAETTAMFTAQRISEHRDGDDLLSAGLGLDGLRAMTPPPFANPEAPTAAELRRRALWANWRGIADLTPA